MANTLVVCSNDDGIDAPGLAALVHALDGLATCRVVAPDSAQSGVGHNLSDDTPIHVRARGEIGLAVAGTPADCARLALSATDMLPGSWHEARRARRVWLVSGINHGANLGVDTYGSGTAAAAREAAILGFPAVAISQYVAQHRTLNWERSILRAAPVLRRLLERPPALGAYWNVNLPHPEDESIDCEIVHCSADPSPHAVRYQRRGEYYEYLGDYHGRPRRPGHDIAVCLGGGIAVTQMSLVHSHSTGHASDTHDTCAGRSTRESSDPA